MIADLFRGFLQWFIGLVESISVLVVILLIGLLVGITCFWVLSRSVRKLAGPPSELDSDVDELNENPVEEVASIQHDQDLPPTDPRT